MHIAITIILLVACYFTVTSFAMQSGKYVVMTNSARNQVCSTDPPSQVLLICPGGEVQCGMQCVTSSCPYFQIKSTTPIQCELYEKLPENLRSITGCIGYFSQAIGLPVDCSLPFTNNGVLYTSCVSGVTCWTVNMTSIGMCPNFGVSGLINNSMIIGGQSVPVQSIFGWLIWMQRVASVTYNWYLPWASFKNGFGSIGDSNYWLGLQRVSQLTSSSKYRLRIEMKLLSTSKWISVEYWSFTVGTEATKYQLNVDGFSGESSTFNGMQFVNLCGSLNFPNGMRFSTSDSRNDASKMYNCAAMFVGSWWYNACGYVSLTGSGTWFRWVDRTCNVLQLAEARMMMKVQ